MRQRALHLAVDLDVALLSRERILGDYYLLTFEHAEVATTARPGQFVMIKAGLSREPPLRRPFSIMRVDADASTFTLFIKVIGVGTAALCALGEGQLARCLGPLGNGFAMPPADEPLNLVAGGYGVAPFVMLLEERFARTRLFYGGRTAGDLPLLDRLNERGWPVVAATEDGSVGVHGRVTRPLVKHLDESPAPATLLACGPEGMLRAVGEIAERRGLSAQVSLDPWMGCGIGTCLGCVVKIQDDAEQRPRLRCACTQGPVFDARSVVWPGATRSAARGALAANP